MSRVEDLVYAEEADLVFINETWLNDDINNEEILHSGYTVYRKDRINRTGGGVLVAMKSASFMSTTI